MRKIPAILLLLCSAGWAQTVTVSANLKTIFAGNQATRAKACFTLVDATGQTTIDPHVAGTGVLVNTDSVCIAPDANGLVSTTMYANDAITVQGVTDVTFWRVEYLYNGSPTHGALYHFAVADVTENLNTKSPATVVPLVVPVPADSVYMRRDAGNSPATASWQFPGLTVTSPGLTVSGNISVGAPWFFLDNTAHTGNFNATGVLGWVSGAFANSTLDTGLSRESAGVVDLGNGTQGDKSGSLKLAGLAATGNVVATTGANQFKAFNFNSVVWLDGINYTSLAAAYAAVPTATYSACGDGIGTCWTGGGGRVEVPPGWIDPAWAANLVLANNKSIHFNGPATFPQGTFQVTMANGVHGVNIVNDASADHSQRTSGVVFDYTGSSDQWSIGSAGGRVSNINIENIQLHSIGGGAAAQPLHIVGADYSTFRHLDLVCSSNSSNTGFGLLYDGGAVGESQNLFEGIIPNFCNNPVKFLNGASGNVWRGGIPTCSGGSACSAGSSNPIFAIVDSAANMFIGVNNGPGAGSFASFFNFSGTSSGNEVWGDNAGTGSFVTTTVIFGASTSKNIYHCLNGGCTFTDSAPNTNRVLDPAASAKIHLTAQGANIGTTTLLTPITSGGQTYRVHVYAAETRAATTSSTMVNVVIGWTDPDSNTAVTFTTAGGSPSANVINNPSQTDAFLTFIINAKAGTNITYQTTGYASSGGTSMQYALTITVDSQPD